jgi:hypothetical protein
MAERTLIGVIGSRECDEETGELAREVGRRIAEAGYVLVCGGLGGVMEAACRGAYEAGGLTVGILPGDSPDAANRYVRVPIATGLGIARNAVIVNSSRIVIAVRGGAGTLSEIAMCLKLGVTVISLRSFTVAPEIIQVKTPADALKEVSRHL